MNFKEEWGWGKPREREKNSPGLNLFKELSTAKYVRKGSCQERASGINKEWAGGGAEKLVLKKLRDDLLRPFRCPGRRGGIPGRKHGLSGEVM